MALSEAQQDKMIAARAAKNKQDKNMPFLINRINGRLMPNTPLMRKLKDYIPYNGSVRASLEDRMRFIATGSSHRVTLAPEVEPEPFDIGAASKEDLIAFAFTEYGAALNDKAPIHILRQQVNKLATAPTPHIPQETGNTSTEFDLG